MTWTDLYFYAFPPFSLIPRLLFKLREEEGECILVAPVWLTQAWFHGDVGRRPLYSSKSTESFYTRKGESTPSVEKVNNDGLSTVRQTLQKRKVSTRSANIIMASWRSGTQKQYNMYIRKWFQFSCQRKISSFQVSINDILDFLAELFENGLKYSAINSARSALSAVGLVFDGFTAGAHPLVIRFFKGVYNLRPPVARYNEIWDVGIVLNYLKTLHI